MAEICGICRQPATKRCSKCKTTFYCGVEHQREAWPIHKKHCGKRTPPVRRIIPDPELGDESEDEPGTSDGSPFGPDAGLSAEHVAELLHIRTCLKNWLKAMERVRAKESNANVLLDDATEQLATLQISEPYAFVPPPPQRFRRVLLSVCKCYFMALVTALSPDKREELGRRLNCIPPYGERIPQFDGQRCVQHSAELDPREYEGLMRSVFHTIIGMCPNSVLRWWRELAEVGVMNWEERV